MKKTVSWSAETIKRKSISCATAKNDESTSSASLSNLQVNLRIQQMIAMQKAQNATMRQLMSTGHVEGLGDLVLPRRDAAASKGTTEKEVLGPRRINDCEPPSQAVRAGSNFNSASGIEPIRSLIHTKNDRSACSNNVTGIHFQGPQKSNSFLPPGGLHQLPPREFRSSPVSTPPHLCPEHDEENSPVSYNSVLDQNFTPIHMLDQKQASTSQPPLMEMQGGDKNNTHAGEKRRPVNLKTNRIPVGEYSFNRLGHPSDCAANESSYRGRRASGIEKNLILSNPEKNRDLKTGPVQTLRNVSRAHDRDTKSTTSPLVIHTDHNFYYGSNGGDFGPPHSPYNCHSETPNSGSQLLQLRIHRRRRDMLLAILCYPFQCLLSSEQLCRSFCFGAIDGMLTGAGILSACVGLGLLEGLMSTNEPFIHAKWIPIALTVSATFSDGICMAIGHIWSMRLVASAAYEERKEELRNFELSRSDAKARLVDALLLQGMLKIDAMSLADTLEGYPDLFVNALLGGGFYVEGGNNGGGFGMVRVTPGESVSSQRQQIGHTWDIPSLSSGRLTGQNRFKNESFCDLSDFRDNLDLKALSETVSASRLEGFLMMLSFCSFSVVPGLIHILLPPVVYFAAKGDAPCDALAILLSFCLAATIMFFLGAWKR